MAGRDEVWTHPDLLPTADDLDDPDAFVQGRPELDISDLTSAPTPDDARAHGEAASDSAARRQRSRRQRAERQRSRRRG